MAFGMGKLSDTSMAGSWRFTWLGKGRKEVVRVVRKDLFTGCPVEGVLIRIL